MHYTSYRHLIPFIAQHLHIPISFPIQPSFLIFPIKLISRVLVLTVMCLPTSLIIPLEEILGGGVAECVIYARLRLWADIAKLLPR